METYDLKLTFTEPLLGTAPMDTELYTNFIAQTRDPEEVEDELETLSLEEHIEKGTTGFHRVEGSPILYDYMLKGFFKDACSMLRRASDSESAKVQAYRKIIDGLLFVEPRRIPLEIADGGQVTILERPLRAQTAQGERVALARSEMVPAGSSIQVRLLVLGKVPDSLLREWLAYGMLRGLGQWRNASYGRFEYELTK